MSDSTPTRELRRQRFRLAEGVVASPQRARGRVTFHLQHPTRGECYQIGTTEAAFVSLLDGRRSFAEAVSLAARSLGRDAPAEPAATQLCTRLVEAGLLAVQEGDSTRQASGDKPRRAWWNPFWQQIPLGKPDRAIAALLPVCRWMFRPLVQWLSVVVMVVAVVVLGTDWDRFSASSRGILSRDNWLWLGAAWLGLKCIHELAHALACRLYGAEVRELGVVCVLFAPMAYVDVTASWQLRSRWQRMHIAAAGMWAELTLAAVAVLVWSHTNSATTAHRLHNVIVMAGATTLLFNLNPLMKFDGYYLLSDLLGLPNLAVRSSTAMQRMSQRILLGRREGWQPEPGATGRWLLGYGVAAALWRVVVTVGLLLTAATLWHGAGLALAATTAALWWGQSLGRIATSLRRLSRDEPAALARGLLIGGLSLAIFAAVLGLTPNPRSATAPGVVDYANAQHVRAIGEGFVQRLHVTSGQVVLPDDLLIELSNPELEAELRELELAWQECEVRRLAAIEAGRLGEAQIEQSTQAGLETRRLEKERQVRNLQLRAERAGRVIARRLSERVGTFVAAGEELCVIGDEGAKEVLLALDQPAAMRLSPGTSLTGWTPSGATFAGRMDRLTPRARTVAPHPGLCAVHGGPLPNREPAGSPDERPQLVEPVVEGRLRLEPAAAQSLAAGQLCAVTTPRAVEKLGPALWFTARDWLSERLAAVEPVTER